MLETIYITTPCFNAKKTIDRTILSIVTQSGNFMVRYHIQDGGSTDGTVERLKWWQRRLNSREFPLSCQALDFSFESVSDNGMYDALAKGIEKLGPSANSFMTWINADDILMPGALAFIDNVASQFTPQQVSWVGGASSVLRGDTPIVNTHIPIPKAALQAGLCDGVHWNFLQQEGTFFRTWMWTAIDPDKNVVPLKLAGDWNLWRLFASKASLIQLKFPLASFCITENQLSARLRDEYWEEINSIVPEAKRKRSLGKLAHKKADIRSRFIKINYSDAGLTVVEDGVNGLALFHSRKALGDDAISLPVNKNTPKVIAKGAMPDFSKLVPLSEFVSFENNIAAYDKGWQFPAITEQHAFHQVRDAASVPEGVTYVAYPWANLIDKLQTKASDAMLHMQQFKEFLGTLPQNTIRVTTCQHIKMQDFLHLFEQAGISHIFWTHTTHQDAADQSAYGFSIHPFPLYPVQLPEEKTVMPITERPYLFSFIGAKSNKYYLTRAREWIIDLLSDHPKGLIIGRDNWHYNKVVYEHQIKPETGAKGGNANDLVDKTASEQFKASMVQSVFSLCPSGSGPNSIRLWESFGSGAIPVILADTYVPPGEPALWEAGVVFCKEDPESIKALPARLEEIAADPNRLEAMRKVGAQLWLLYGPDSFVYDAQKLMLQLAQGSRAVLSDRAPVTSGFRDILAAKMEQKHSIDAKDAQLLLRVCGSDLLLEGKGLLAEMRSGSTVLGKMLEQAQEILPENNTALTHFRGLQTYVAARKSLPQLATPGVASPSAVKIAFFGRHANRTPLSYPAFQKMLGSRIQIETDLAKADVVMTGFNLDLKENPKEFEALAKESPDTRVMVVSEEPLWDSTWSGGFVTTSRKIKCGDTDVGYTFLNHSNSDIFAFDQIPYFLLTEDDLLARYALLIQANCHLSPKALLEQWRHAPVSAAFVAEKREGDMYAKSFPEHALFGLSKYRSDVAAQIQGQEVLREGKGWHSDKPRQDLPDWHLDKLAALNRRVRVMSSYENTHQQNYISEKIFDAFVVGGIPTYYADENHSISRLVAPECMINTYGASSEAAAQAIADVVPDMAMAEAWIDTAQKLQKRMIDHKAVVAERQRVVDAIMQGIGAP